ncbi:lipid-A-disaccharide synthase [Halocynthiibacter styelae]|uniref:Lipid-A-disaccharide synthase n=1 Tax=Halocynthiibacter styelae TaxID=2761955 RepID=A0A8J7IU12_9RHOB|nr:lipid-A-disaccharide synthase [Paenihalocynthiibacter styelae]MBI1492318.1 lipid-A-disaccharide synthase [Paenihalocynthiibacter styelae]
MKVFLIAGEASGDKLGAALMEGLISLVPDIEFRGVGGDLMGGQGLVSQFPMHELSVMGIAEVAPKYFHLKRRIREVAEAALAWQPDAIVSIDSPDFCLRVAKIVKAARDIPTVHYVAPSVWAWREGRAAKMAKHIDHVLALLPFEPPYMQAAGMTCEFVGHPVVAEPLATADEITAFADTYHITPDQKIMLLLPGSRMGEVTRMLPVLREVAEALSADHPDMRFILPAAPGPVSDLIYTDTEDWPSGAAPLVIDPTDKTAKRAAFARADLALAASGTVSLELAANDTPMVIAYDMNWLSRKLIKRMLKIDTVTLVNLVSETRTVPEFLGESCTSGQIIPAVEALLSDPSAQKQAMSVTMERLGRGSEAPGLRAARSVLNRI